MNLRPYQQECLESISQAYRSGANRLLASLPTGTGKTVIFAHLPKALGLAKKMLVIAHREELLDQAKDKIIAANPELRVEIEQAGRKADPGADVVIASVATIGRSGSKRIEKFNPHDFGVIICDEAHHAVASTYHNIFNYFGLPDNKEVLLVGFTATPKRGDGVGLEEVFDEIVFHRDMKAMIADKWLSPITGYRISSGTDLSGVHTRMGDFIQGELSNTVNNSNRNALVVKSYLDKTRDKKAIVFAVDVRHAYDLAKVFRQASIPCAAITGEMDSEQRHSIIEGFRQDKLRVLTNCQVLTEGFDQPDIEAIIMARPTQSGLLYTQMIGRGTRLHPGKEKLTVIDIADNSRKHSLVNLPTLFGLPAKFDLKGHDLIKAGEQIEQAIEKHPGLDLDRVINPDMLKIQLEKIDFFTGQVTLPSEVERFSRLTWFKLPDGSFRLSLAKGEYATISENLLGQWEITLAIEGGITTTIPNKPRELQRAFAIADKLIDQVKPSAIPYLLTKSRWRGEEATDKQLETLSRLGILFPENITKGEASILISKFFAVDRAG